MNIREAILKAADHIERNPQAFDFTASGVPLDAHCGTPGCALGWIGCFYGLGKSHHVSYEVVASEALQLAAEHMFRDAKYLSSAACCFYNRMDDLDSGLMTWATSADECARAMRLYADQYHPAETKARDFIPASVRAIFTESEATAWA